MEELVLDTPVTLCLETLQDHPSNETLLDILPQTSRAAFGVVLDTGHCHIARDLVGMPQQFGRRLKGLHIHDNDGKSDQHRTIGHGTTDWGTFAADLRQAHYEGPLMLEAGASPHGEDPQTLLRRSREALEDIQRQMTDAARL
jgi:sugar phosphate isomerase/epimerase